MSWLTDEAALQNKLVDGKEVIDAQICLQTIIIWTAQDGSAQICFGSIAAPRLTSKVCLGLGGSGSLTGVRLFSRPRAPAPYSTRPNCVLCSVLLTVISVWYSETRVVSMTCSVVSPIPVPNLSANCRIFVWGQCHFKMFGFLVPSDDLIDWLHAAIGLIMVSWEWKTERSVCACSYDGFRSFILFYFFYYIFIFSSGTSVTFSLFVKSP